MIVGGPPQFKMDKYMNSNMKASTCGPCDLYQMARRDKIKAAKDAGLDSCLRSPLNQGTPGTLMQDVICE
jgi:hypothetical protein